jgi:signal transduction histidine kinase
VQFLQRVKADGSSMTQVLLNLMGNTLLYKQAGGKVIVSLGSLETDSIV